MYKALNIEEMLLLIFLCFLFQETIYFSVFCYLIPLPCLKVCVYKNVL
jgi:hypothetical protein